MKNRKSLVALKEGLKTLNEDQFYYAMFVKEYEVKKGSICGTKCCAAGWLPKFAPGLGFSWSSAFGNGCLLYDGKLADNTTFKMFFHIDRDESDFIFYGCEIPKKYNYKGTNHARFGIEHFVTLRQVINRIDLVLHHNKDENENA